jgi:tellurite resistance protein TerC
MASSAPWSSGRFIACDAVLIENFAWVLSVFGAFLVFTGWKMFRHRHEETDRSRRFKSVWASFPGTIR